MDFFICILGRKRPKMKNKSENQNGNFSDINCLINNHCSYINNTCIQCDWTDYIAKRNVFQKDRSITVLFHQVSFDTFIDLHSLEVSWKCVNKYEITVHQWYQNRVRYIALKIYLKFTEPKSNARVSAWSIPHATHSITSVMSADCWNRICCLKTTRHKLKYTWKYPCLQVIKMIYEKLNVMAYFILTKFQR